MKRFMGVSALFALSTTLVGCNQETNTVEEGSSVYEVENGGFETGDLSGWTILEGNAFSEDAVATVETFWDAAIPYGHTGNWHLVGTGFDGSIVENETGKLKSSIFKLGGDGKISFKLGGGKDAEKCYLAVYLKEGDKLIAKQGNQNFLDPGTADIGPYEAGLAATNNYSSYELDLSAYLGQEMYIVLVDADNDGDFGFINVDDIRTYYVDGVAVEQPIGEKVEKIREIEEVVAENEFVIANPGFESGNLSGWTIIEGNAFDHKGVTSDPTWWDEEVPYNRDGEYHYGMFNEGDTGVLRSSTFTLNGTGYITFKLGGGKNPAECYISIWDAETNTELKRYSNSEFADVNFPNVEEGLRLANLVQYKADLSEFIGKKLYIEIVDQATSDWGLLTFDSFNVYQEQEPLEGVEATNILE